MFPEGYDIAWEIPVSAKCYYLTVDCTDYHKLFRKTELKICLILCFCG